MRIGIKRLLWTIVVASLFCMAARSLIPLEPIGILVWPVLFGFGSDRFAARDGIAGGSLCGAVGLGMASLSLQLGPALGFLFLLAGACWGFYLSIWAYIIVETILQSV